MAEAVADKPTAHRDRLLAGLAASIDEKGLGATTVADIVRHARVSKRTFYEHFTSKEDCFHQLALAATDRVLSYIEEQLETDEPWEERLERGLRIYFEFMAAEPAVTRTFLVEAQGAGAEGVRLRRAAHRRYAAILVRLSERAHREEPRVLRPISPAMATAIVGGLNELMLEAVEDGRAERLPELLGTATELIRSVVTAPE